jgi:hypothetical protein
MATRLTLFSIPKPFRGHIGVIQRNAIQSWTRLRPQTDIVLFGDEAGTREIAQEFEITHVPAIARNEYGTPLVDVLFHIAHEATRSPVLGYVNADIILMADLFQAVERVRSRSTFLMIGQRWDVDLDEPWDFGHLDWQARLRALVAGRGRLHPETGLDYFVYPRGLWGGIPPFALGRGTWDNWLVYAARARGAVVVDATAVVMAVHQNHSHDHVANGAEGFWTGPEAKGNLDLAGDVAYTFTSRDATHLLTPCGLRLALKDDRWRRHLDTLPLLHPPLRWVVPPARRVVQLLRRVLP